AVLAARNERRVVQSRGVAVAREIGGARARPLVEGIRGDQATAGGAGVVDGADREQARRDQNRRREPAHREMRHDMPLLLSIRCEGRAHTWVERRTTGSARYEPQVRATTA